METQMEERPKVIHKVGPNKRNTTIIKAVSRPIMLFARGMSGDQTLMLWYVLGGSCENFIRTPVKHCGCFHAMSKEHNHIVTPFPGSFQLSYDGTGQGVEILEIPLPYSYSFEMLVPRCCGECTP